MRVRSKNWLLSHLRWVIRKKPRRSQSGEYFHFPLSLFLREELGNPDLSLLANDSTRVLNLAAQYMRLGLYQRALVVLSRNYPPPQADQSEPSELPPGKHPMIAYFRVTAGSGSDNLGRTTIASRLNFRRPMFFPVLLRN